MKILRPSLQGVVLGVVVLLSSCATEPKPGIVVLVENAPTPVQSVKVANDHLLKLMDAVGAKAPQINSATELGAVIVRLGDAFQACDIAYKRLMTIDTVTAADDKYLKEFFSRTPTKAGREMGKVLLHKAEKYAGDGVLSTQAQQALYWVGEWENTVQKLSRKPFKVQK